MARPSAESQKLAVSELLATRGLSHAVSWLEFQSRVEFGSYELLLRECGNSKALFHGRQLHSHILKSGHQQITFLANLLLEMYAKCDCLDKAREVFDELREPNVFSWTLIITAYSKHRRDAEAVYLFRAMDLEGTKPDEYVISTVVTVCTRTADRTLGESLHRRVLEFGMDWNLVVANALVNMYGKWGRVEEARHTFDSFCLCDPVSWNSLLTAYTQNGCPLAALGLLREMELEGVKPTSVTYIILLDACSSLESAAAGERIHSRISTSGMTNEPGVRGALVNMYGKCGRVETARDVFDGMVSPDVVAWNSMLGAYAQNNHGKEALELFSRMDLEGTEPSRVTFLIVLDACSSLGLADRSLHARMVALGFMESDIAVSNSVISMYSKSRSLESARSVFDGVHRKDTVSWNTMISAYAQNGHHEQARQLFRQMDLEGARPDRASFSSVLEACTLAQGKEVHLRLTTVGLRMDALLVLALLTMYGRNNQPGDARKLFDSVSRTYTVVLWNAMLAVYIHCSEYAEVLQLHRRMDLLGFKPNNGTFAHLLTSCSMLGEVRRGKAIHSRMLASGFPENINVVTSTALINLYSRAGNLTQARRLFEETHGRDVVCWTAMVVAYAQQGHGKEAVEVFMEMQQEGVAPTEVTFINILFACSHSGLVDEGCQYFLAMTGDHLMDPVVDHYMCLVDMFGRVGKVAEAKELVECMPFTADKVAWMTLIGACTTQGDMDHGEVAVRRLCKLGAEKHTPYIMFKNLIHIK